MEKKNELKRVKSGEEWIQWQRDFREDNNGENQPQIDFHLCYESGLGLFLPVAGYFFRYLSSEMTIAKIVNRFSVAVSPCFSNNFVNHFIEIRFY
jgi:hypothetical protein